MLRKLDIPRLAIARLSPKDVYSITKSHYVRLLANVVNMGPNTYALITLKNHVSVFFCRQYM